MRRKGGIKMRGRSLGIILLSIYLILAGLGLMIGLTFMYFPLLLGALAIAAGVALLLGR